MQPNGLGRSYRLLRTVGSLWFAALLLSLLLLAMACATVFESSQGSERALVTFYHAWWFETLLTLFGVNVLATLIVRYPFTRRQTGFVITHASILLILAGALLTANYGIDGSIGIIEGQSENVISAGGSVLTAIDQQSGTRQELDLGGPVGSGFEERTITGSSLDIGATRISVDQYLPDTTLQQTVTNGADRGRPAVQLTLSDNQGDDTDWIFAGTPTDLGPVQASYRVLTGEDQLAEFGEPDKAEPAGSIGSVRLTVGGNVYAIPLERCLEKPQNVGNTGITAKVLRYLPHATVAAEGKLVNSSPNPVNPAIELELTKDGVTEKRLAFAKFPDFASMHSKEQLMDVKVVFDFSPSTTHAPLEILSLPSGRVFVRMTSGEAKPALREVKLGESIETLWPDVRLTINQVFERASRGQEVVAADPIRDTRIPAVHVAISDGGQHTRDAWVRRGFETQVLADNSRFQLVFGDKQIPLDFQVRLDQFRVGFYPGTKRPRSFESHVAITDAATGMTQSRVISMNHPTKYGGYTLYQSSYRMDPGRTVSYLSVSRDPGQWVVFAGYIGTLLGMLVVLSLRMKEHRQVQADLSVSNNAHQARRNHAEDISLLIESPACLDSAGRMPLHGAAPRPVPLSRSLGPIGGSKKCK